MFSKLAVKKANLRPYESNCKKHKMKSKEDRTRQNAKDRNFDDRERRVGDKSNYDGYRARDHNRGRNREIVHKMDDRDKGRERDASDDLNEEERYRERNTHRKTENNIKKHSNSNSNDSYDRTGGKKIEKDSNFESQFVKRIEDASERRRKELANHDQLLTSDEHVVKRSYEVAAHMNTSQTPLHIDIPPNERPLGHFSDKFSPQAMHSPYGGYNHNANYSYPAGNFFPTRSIPQPFTPPHLTSLPLFPAGHMPPYTVPYSMGYLPPPPTPYQLHGLPPRPFFPRPPPRAPAPLAPVKTSVSENDASHNNALNEAKHNELNESIDDDVDDVEISDPSDFDYDKIDEDDEDSDIDINNEQSTIAKSILESIIMEEYNNAHKSILFNRQLLEWGKDKDPLSYDKNLIHVIEAYCYNNIHQLSSGHNNIDSFYNDAIHGKDQLTSTSDMEHLSSLPASDIADGGGHQNDAMNGEEEVLDEEEDLYGDIVEVAVDVDADIDADAAVDGTQEQNSKHNARVGANTSINISSIVDDDAKGVSNTNENYGNLPNKRSKLPNLTPPAVSQVSPIITPMNRDRWY